MYQFPLLLGKQNGFSRDAGAFECEWVWAWVCVCERECECSSMVARIRQFIIQSSLWNIPVLHTKYVDYTFHRWSSYDNTISIFILNFACVILHPVHKAVCPNSTHREYIFRSINRSTRPNSLGRQAKYIHEYDWWPTFAFDKIVQGSIRSE